MIPIRNNEYPAPVIKLLHGTRKAVGLASAKDSFLVNYWHPTGEDKKLKKGDKVIVFLAPAKVPHELNIQVTMILEANKENSDLIAKTLQETNTPASNGQHGLH
jgi:hypothetical protein